MVEVAPWSMVEVVRWQTELVPRSLLAGGVPPPHSSPSPQPSSSPHSSPNPHSSRTPHPSSSTPHPSSSTPYTSSSLAPLTAHTT